MGIKSPLNEPRRLPVRTHRDAVEENSSDDRVNTPLCVSILLHLPAQHRAHASLLKVRLPEKRLRAIRVRPVRPVIKIARSKAAAARLLSSVQSELEQFLISQAALRQRISEASVLDLTAWRFASPVAGYFRVNLLEFFSVCNAHSRRHICQAHNVRRALFTGTQCSHA